MQYQVIHRFGFFATCLLAASSQAVLANDFATDFLDNTQFQFETHIDGFLDNAAARTDREIKDDSFASFSRLKIESQADVTDNLMFNASLDLIGTLRNTNRGAFSEPDTENDYSRFIDINEAYLTYEADMYDLQIGKITHQVGFAEINSIIDNFNRTNTNSPIHSVKMGTWQAKATYYLDDFVDYEDSVTVIARPFDDRAGAIPSNSRWLGNSSDGAFFESANNLEDDYRSSELSNWGVTVEYRGVREGYDFVLGAHRGPSVNPVVRSELDLSNFPIISTIDYKNYPTAQKAYGGVNYTDDSLQLYSEFVVQNVLSGKDDDTIHGLVGGSYKETDYANQIGLDEITPYIEYARERVLHDQSHPNFSQSSKDARVFTNTLSMRLKFVYDSDYTLQIGTSKNLKFSDYFHNLNFEYKHNDNNYVYLNAYMFGGASDTQFGRWAENDLISVGYLRKF